MGENHKEVLRQISRICSKHGVTIIDDLIYEKTIYYGESIPIAQLDEGDISKVITLMGISKAYGAAGIRAGMIVADENTVRTVRDYIFQDQDSISFIVENLLVAAFSTKNESKPENVLF